MFVKFDGRWEMIWSHYSYSNFIIFRLNIKLLPAQHVLLSGATSLSSVGELPDDFMEPFCKRFAVTLMGSELCSFLTTAVIPCPVGHNVECKFFLSTNCR